MLTPEILEIMEVMRSDSEGDWPQLESLIDFPSIRRHLNNVISTREGMAAYVKTINLIPPGVNDTQEAFEAIAEELDLIHPDYPKKTSLVFELLSARKGKQRNVFILE